MGTTEWNEKSFYSKYRYHFNSKFLSQGRIGVYEG